MAPASFDLKAYKESLDSDLQIFLENVESESSIISYVRQRRTDIESATEERKARHRAALVGQRQVRVVLPLLVESRLM